MTRPLPSRFIAYLQGGILALLLSLLAAVPVAAQSSIVLVSNVGQSRNGVFGLEVLSGTQTVVMAFTTGAVSLGYILDSVELHFGAVASPTVKYVVSIHEDDNGEPGGKLGDLTAPTSLTANALNTFTTDGILLLPSTTYILAIESSSAARNSLTVTESTAEDAASLDDWSIADTIRILYTDIANVSGLPTPRFRLNGRLNTQITGLWSLQTSGTTHHLNDVYFTDASNGWIVGEGGTILRTTNGGRSWSAQTSGTTHTLRGVHFVDARKGWVVGNLGTILHTRDGGASWNPQTTQVTLAIDDVFFVDARRGWARTTGGVVRTTNGGATWRFHSSGTTQAITHLGFVNAWEGWAVGFNGTILHTTDGGVTWRAQTSGTTSHLISVDFVDASEGWAVGLNGTILHTTDGGATWSAQSSGTTQLLTAVDFAYAGIGWAVGAVGTVLRTTDGGATWSAQDSGTTEQLNAAHFLADASKGWVVGRNGTIVSFDYLLPALDLGLWLFHECCIYEGDGHQRLQLQVDLEPTLPHHVEVSLSYDLGETADDFESFHVEDVTIPAGWNWVTSVVTATPLDDTYREPEQRLTVTASITAGGGTYTASQELKLIDDDPYGADDPSPDASPAVIVWPATLTVDEAGHAATYSVELDSRPTGTVTVKVSSSDAGTATASPTSLIFTPDDWFMPHTVTVTGINDDVDNPDDRRTVTITHSVTGGGYDGWAVDSVSVTVRDDDSGSSVEVEEVEEVNVVLWATRIRVHESLGNAAYGVTLASRPSETVTVSVSSSDTSIVTVSESVLRFTPDNWDTRQLVWVYPVDDDIDNPEDRVAVITNTASGGGNSATLTVTVLDDE